jgi:hypothetical protein
MKCEISDTGTGDDDVDARISDLLEILRGPGEASIQHGK